MIKQTALNLRQQKCGL